MEFALPVLQQLAPAGAARLAEVAFKGTRRAFYRCADEEIKEGVYVLVEAERGQDLGRVRSVGGVATRKCSAAGAAASLRIVRRAEPDEVRQWLVLRSDEERVRRQARELVEKHHLKMKVSEAEWQWDRNKLTIFFTAERRVDFRELVRDLARTFRTRIELKQIGVRDEAALLGGVGRCGRQLCCATWLREIKPVSLQLAKDQNLSLNPSQISGTCGRLMCCLTYEHDSYLQARKRFPREGKIVRTRVGAERVVSIDIWRETVTLADENRQRRVVSLGELRSEIAAASHDAPGGGPATAGAPQPAPRDEPTGAGPESSSSRPIRGQRPSSRPAPRLRTRTPPPETLEVSTPAVADSDAKGSGTPQAPRSGADPGGSGDPKANLGRPGGRGRSGRAKGE
jgi:cell fate regulator YaaT (PSP1 superfamily)